MRKLMMIALAAGLAGGGMARAEMIEFSAMGKGMSKSEMHQVAEGQMIMVLHSDYSEMTSDNPDNPLMGAKGPCMGTAHAAGAMMSGGGFCDFTDSDGEKATISWTVTGAGEKGEIMGDWQVSGGTGKWMKASGGGTFSSLTDQATGNFENQITGKLDM